MRRILSTIVSVSVVAGLAACGSSSSYVTPPVNPTPSPQAATVNATSSLAFAPGNVTVAPGGTVTFAFGSVGHNVKFDTGTNPPTDITGSNANISIPRAFAAAGTYTYHCTIHPSMTGTITVAATAMASTNNPPPTNNGGY